MNRKVLKTLINSVVERDTHYDSFHKPWGWLICGELGGIPLTLGGDPIYQHPIFQSEYDRFTSTTL